jgi:hypothetical protein
MTGMRTSVLGKRFNNRVVVAARSDRLHHADGILPKNRPNVSAALALGNADKRAASIHGSEPLRANAEIIVSVVPLSPVPISANRKSFSLASNWLILTFILCSPQYSGTRADVTRAVAQVEVSVIRSTFISRAIFPMSFLGPSAST